jgi:uncharacterized coiled-coil protein SlyX
MKDRLERRLKELTAEFETGQKMLAELEARQEALRDTMLRLDGAITVLTEELQAADEARGDPPSATEGGSATDAPSATEGAPATNGATAPAGRSEALPGAR